MAESPKPIDEHKASVDVVIQDAPAAAIEENALDPVYAAKARVLNKAIQDIGMGRYQWQVRREVFLISPFAISYHLSIPV
jgi:hypothetical protein